MSTGALSKARLDRMHAVMAGHVERGDVPGIVTLVSRWGEIHADAIGTMASGGRAPMQRDTIFRIASVTKPIVAVAANPGRFGWDGGYGTSWHADPAEELTAIMLTQVLTFPGELYEHFWTSVYQALDD